MAVRDQRTEWVLVQMYRRLTPQERIWIAAQMFEDGVAIVRSSRRCARLIVVCSHDQGVPGDGRRSGNGAARSKVPFWTSTA
jgi:hypothetical protein